MGPGRGLVCEKLLSDIHKVKTVLGRKFLNGLHYYNDVMTDGQTWVGTNGVHRLREILEDT
jgi:hypothetical protein